MVESMIFVFIKRKIIFGFSSFKLDIINHRRLQTADSDAFVNYKLPKQYMRLDVVGGLQPPTLNKFKSAT
jgi:hypothetical protein